MRYTGNICDGCNEPLLENEDIVVCPECGAPQHRHCYDKNGKCVNHRFHEVGFTWQGTVSENTSAESSTLVNLTAEKGEDIICPNCQHSNPKGTEVCRNCGMKFTMFGINVVEALEQQGEKDSAPTQEIPEYKPPFQVGIGEGFEYTENTESSAEEKPAAPTPENPEYFSDDSNIFRGPYPDNDYTAGVKTNTIGAFIRNNAQTYIAKFKISDINGRNSFNWAAFFFSPYWFFYRRLYKPGIIIMTLQFCISLIATPALEKFLSAYENFAAADMTTITDEALAALMTQLQSVLAPMWLLMGITFVIHLISGIIANRLYKSYVVKNINLAMRLTTVRERINHFAKNGGASMIAVLVAYVAEYALSFLASFLMY